MKLIYITSYGDYGALSFSKEFRGYLVSNFIKEYFNPEELSVEELEENEVCIEGNDEEYIVKLYEVEKPHDSFLEFYYDRLRDYDQSKHANFWFEDEMIDG